MQDASLAHFFVTGELEEAATFLAGFEREEPPDGLVRFGLGVFCYCFSFGGMYRLK